MRESSQSWRDLLLDVRRPGLTTGPQIAVADGVLGFWKALGEVWPSVDAAHAGDAGFAPENQVRTRLPAGAKRIRTVGPSPEGVSFSGAIDGRPDWHRASRIPATAPSAPR